VEERKLEENRVHRAAETGRGNRHMKKGYAGKEDRRTRQLQTKPEIVPPPVR
jgi:hypothetical protein